jgi:hypothetical protein
MAWIDNNLHNVLLKIAKELIFIDEKDLTEAEKKILKILLNARIIEEIETEKKEVKI